MELYVKKEPEFQHVSSIKMDFQLSDEPKDMRRALRDFAKGKVKDFTQEWGSEKNFQCYLL